MDVRTSGYQRNPFDVTDGSELLRDRLPPLNPPFFFETSTLSPHSSSMNESSSLNRTEQEVGIPEMFENDPLFQEHICPISQSPIREPLKFTSRQNGYEFFYEASAIRKWLGTNSTDPSTRERVTLADYKEDIELKNKIEKRLEELMPRLKPVEPVASPLVYNFFSPVINFVSNVRAFLSNVFRSIFSSKKDRETTGYSIQNPSYSMSFKEMIKTLFAL